MNVMKATLEMAEAAKRSPTALGLANREQVNGIGIGKNADGYTLKVNLIEPLGSGLPKEIGGVPVSVDVVGRAYPAA
jgi:hypothetical protein